VLKVLLVYKVPKERLVLKEFKVLLGYKVLKALKEQQEHRVFKVQ
jgi:hypothetical protein